MARIIAIVNQKGGVGKTTTAVNLSSYIAKQGKFVLLIDLDPQANASSGLGQNSQEQVKSIYEVLTGQFRLSDIIQETSQEGLRVAPASMQLAGASVELVQAERREYRLSEALLEVKHAYDYIFIDCPPSLGLLTVNSLVAAQEVLIPVQCEYYALEGLGQLLKTIDLVKQHLQPNLEVLGAVLTMFDKRNGLSREVLEEIYKYFPKRVFRSVIPRNVRLAEAPSHGKSISQYDASSKGAKAYEKLAEEILATEINTHL